MKIYTGFVILTSITVTRGVTGKHYSCWGPNKTVVEEWVKAQLLSAKESNSWVNVFGGFEELDIRVTEWRKHGKGLTTSENPFGIGAPETTGQWKTS